MSINISLKTTEVKEVEVSTKDIYNIVRTYANVKTRFKSHYFIKDGKVYYEEDVGTHKAVYRDMYVRDATLEDISIYSFMRILSERIKKGE